MYGYYNGFTKVTRISAKMFLKSEITVLEHVEAYNLLNCVLIFSRMEVKYE